MKMHAVFNYSNYPIHYRYDTSGLKIEKYAKYYDTTIIWYKNVYQYDNKNNLISDTYYYLEDGALEFSSMSEYGYNDLNQLVRKVWRISENFADSTTYTYYRNGKLKTETTHPKYSDDYLTWVEFKYDSNNKLISKQLYYFNEKGKKKKGWLQIIEYEFF